MNMDGMTMYLTIEGGRCCSNMARSVAGCGDVERVVMARSSVGCRCDLLEVLDWRLRMS